MIICVIEGFGWNLEPYISELCPAWVEFKRRATLYANNYTAAGSTWQTCVGLLTGEYPAYSTKPKLEIGYSRDIKNIHRTFLSSVQANSVLLTKGCHRVIREAFKRVIDNPAPETQLKGVLRQTPRPRLIWVCIFPGAAIEAPTCLEIRNGLPVREALSKSKTFDPVGINAAIKPLLGVRDEVVVVCGDHGNSWEQHLSHACNLDEGTIKTVLAIFNPKDGKAKVETRLTSHLDLVVTLRGLLGWPDWSFSDDAFEHGLEQREFAYSRTCLALQGQFGHAAGLDKPPRICITDGRLRVEMILPIIPADAKPKLWERPLEGTMGYYLGSGQMKEPTERHQMMEKKLIDLERRYRQAALKYLGME